MAEGWRLGPYRIERLLGSGGMGAVYEAIDERYGSRVAIKALAARLDEVRLRALKREFRTMGGFAHRNVVQIYGLRGDDSGWYSVMELVDGTEFLPFVLGDSGAWSSARGLPVLRQLAAGLHALHQAGWVHRDLKSSNVIVERESGRTVILDFGLVEALRDPVGPGEARIGTPSHMAPELLQGARGSSASDWYAVGVMMAEALLGPSPGADPRDRITASLATEGDRGLRDLLDLAADLLSRDPRERPAARAVLERLGVQQPARGSARLSTTVEGRDVETALLSRAWDDARNGATVVVEVSGAPGVGKTALVQSFLSRVEAEGSGDVLASRCHVNEQIPFKAVDRLVESVAALARGRRAEGGAFVDAPVSGDDLGKLLADLAGVGPDVADRAAPSAAGLAQRRAEAFARLRQMLQALSRLHPLVLFIDDVQWGDADSAQLLRAVLQGDPLEPPAKVLVVWTLRWDSEDTPFVSEVRRSRMEQEHRFERLRLDNLDAATAERLARALFETDEDALVRRVVEETGGNPLLLTKAAQAGARLDEAPSGSLMESLIDADMRGMAPGARQLVNVLAVANLPLVLSVALRAVGQELDIYNTVAALRRARLVSLSTDGDRSASEERIELDHDQLRAAILRRLEAPLQTRLHLDLAHSIEASDKPNPGVLATHFHAAGELQPAARYALDAAEEASSSLAFLAAAQHYRDALAWGRPSGEQRGTLQQRLADALFSAGHCADSARAYESAQASAAERAPDVAVKEATAWFAAGHVDRGLRSVQPLLRAMHLWTPPAFLVIPVAVAKVAWLRIRARDVPLAQGATDAEAALRADVCWAVGQGTSMFLAAMGAFFGVQSLLEAIRSRDGHRIARALAFVGGVCVNAGGGTAVWGDACLRRAEAFAEDRGDGYLLGWCHVWRANAYLVRGDFDRAIDRAESGIALIEQGPFAMSWECHTARCFALMARERRGDLAGVEQGASRVLRMASARDDLFGQVVFSLFLAFGALTSGRAETARTMARDAMARWTSDAFTVQHLYAIRVEVYCDLYEGEPQRAWERVEAAWKAIQGSDVLGVPSARLDALVMRAHAALARARGGARRSSIRMVRRIARSVRRQSVEASAHATLLAASASMLAGDPRRAVVEAGQARETFDRLGMRIWSAVAHDAELVAGGASSASGAEAIHLRLAECGIRDPARWLRVVAPAFHEPPAEARR
jgi:hypothetical protein